MGDEKASPINIDLGASAKLEVKGEIPASSMGRLVDSLTDAIRPFTEKRGLKADQVRLQREEVLIEIARRTKERLEIEGKEVNEVSNKVLVPLLEKASLTDGDSNLLVNTWANLLYAATKENRPNINIFIELLSQMDKEHLVFLEFLFDLERLDYLSDDYLHLPTHKLKSVFSKFCRNARSEKIWENDQAFDDAHDKLVATIERPGLKVISGGLQGRDIYGSVTGKFSEQIYNPLAGRGLIEFERFDIASGSIDDFDWIYCIRATLFGADFVSTCKFGESIYDLPNEPLLPDQNY